MAFRHLAHQLLLFRRNNSFELFCEVLRPNKDRIAKERTINLAAADPHFCCVTLQSGFILRNKLLLPCFNAISVVLPFEL